MGLCQTDKHFTYMIFPFKTSKTFNDVENIRLERSNGKSHPIWERYGLKLNKPQEDFRLLFDMDNERRNIVKQYRSNPNLNKELGIGKRYYVQAKGEKTVVEIEGLNLFFFDMGVGFFAVKMNYQTKDTERILELNYLLSDVKRKESRLFCEEDGEGNGISLIAFLQRTLAEHIPIFDFDERGGLDYVDRKPLNFSYYLLCEKGDDESFGQLLFDARSNYISSYKAPESDKSMNSASNLQTFENSFWGVSLNGAVNISFKTGDARTDHFFEGEFPLRLQGAYLAIYLNVLNRYFTLKEIRNAYLELDGANIYSHEQSFKSEIDKNKINKKVLKRIEKQEVALLTEYCDKVSELNNRATVFALKNAHTLPSNIEHVNEVYMLMNRIYGVDGLKDRLMKDIVSAKEIGKSFLRRVNQLSDAVRALKKAKSEIFIYCILTLFGFLSTFRDLVGIVEFYIGETILNTGYMWIPWAIIAVPVGVLFFKIVDSTLDYFKKKKDLEDLILQ